jgi:putative transposase
MARPLRIQFENAYYHVMNRGAARCATFSRQEHYELFLALLADVVERFGIEIHCYCLLKNHYHLLIKTPYANLARAMRHVDGVYTQRYNRLEQRDGPLFRGRYKAIVIDSDNYLVTVSRYIHRNPVEAAICKDPKQYKWSSYAAYLGEAPRPEWLPMDEILNNTSEPMVQSYRDLVENPLQPSLREYNLDESNSSPIFGTDQFCEDTRALVSHLFKHPEIPQARLRHRQPSLMVVVNSTAAAFGKVEQDLLTSRKGQTNDARSAAIFLACRKYRHAPNNVAKAFGISYWGISVTTRRFEKVMQRDIGIRNVVNKIIDNLDN